MVKSKCPRGQDGHMKVSGVRVPTTVRRDWQHLWSTGMQVRSPARPSGLRIQHFSSDQIPELRTPCAAGQSKKKKKLGVTENSCFLKEVWRRKRCLQLKRITAKSWERGHQSSDLKDKAGLPMWQWQECLPHRKCGHANQEAGRSGRG